MKKLGRLTKSQEIYKLIGILILMPRGRLNHNQIVSLEEDLAQELEDQVQEDQMKTQDQVKTKPHLRVQAHQMNLVKVRAPALVHLTTLNIQRNHFAQIIVVAILQTLRSQKIRNNHSHQTSALTQ